MPNLPLGSLTNISAREVWTNEATDFTPWLAAEDNIRVLGASLGLDLLVESTELSVGPFRADIVCRDQSSERLVLIENQLERTDHSHLGQLLTYSAGLEACVVVWLSPRFTDEHRAALDWLNRKTSEELDFFGVEIEVWRIGDSAAAPRFRVVCQPNNWQRSVRVNLGTTTSPNRELLLEFWAAFSEWRELRGLPVRKVRGPVPGFYFLGEPKPSFRWHAHAVVPRRRLSVDLFVSHQSWEEVIALLRQRAEHLVAGSLAWKSFGNCGALEIGRDNVEVADRTKWPSDFEWFVNTYERARSGLEPVIEEILAELSEQAT